jgi:[lysine-biosynthesis-protein LysW]--L-2-aminoadipate ligase
LGTVNIGKDTSSLYILFDNIRWEEKSIIEKAKEIGRELKAIDCKDLVLFLNDSSNEFEDKIILQRSVSYFRSLHSTGGLEGLGARMINSLYTAFMCGNKLISHIELHKNGILTPKAICAFTPESSLRGLDKLGYPAVIKPTVGSWGRLIGLINDKEGAKTVLEDREHMFPIYHISYFEEFVKRPPRDIRAIVIGEEVVAAIYRYSGDNEWKTNMALGGHALPCPITKIFKGDIVGVDLMESEKYGLVVHEVNNTTEFKNTVKVTGVDIPKLIINYMENLLKK